MKKKIVLISLILVTIFLSGCSTAINTPTNPPAGSKEPTIICASFEYSDWSICTTSGTQSRSITKSLPLGCVGGSPVISQQCSYQPIISSEFLEKKNNLVKACDNYVKLINSPGLEMINKQYADEYKSCHAKIQNLPNVSIEEIQSGKYREYATACTELLWYFNDSVKNLSFRQDRINDSLNNDICGEIRNANSDEEFKLKIDKYGNYLMEYVNLVRKSSEGYNSIINKITVAESRISTLINSSIPNMQQQQQSANRIVGQELKEDNTVMLNMCLSTASAYLGSATISTIELEKMRIAKRTECYLRYPQ